MAAIIDNGLRLGVAYVVKNAAFMVLIGIVGLGSALVCQYMASKVTAEIGTDIRNVLFAKINTYSSEILDKFGTSTLITRLNNDVNQVQTAIATFIRLAVRAPFLIIGAAVMSRFIDLRLSMVFIVLIPLIAVSLWIVTVKTIPLYRLVQGKLDKITASFSEHLAGIRVIRAFNTTEREAQEFSKETVDYRNNITKTSRISAALNPITFLFTNLAIAYILFVGSKQITAGTLTAGELIAFIGYLTQISLTMGIVANLIVIFTKASASSARIMEIVETDTVIPTTHSDNVYSINTHSILEFRNVNFCYAGAKSNTVSDVSFCVGAGDALAIVGSTGSGKSTLVNLIPRFYDYSSGVIILNGKPIRDYGLRELREAIRVVPQKSVLFTGTILENLRFGNRFADYQTAEKALEIACLPASRVNPDTPVSAGGKNFSGGERQRIAIARAIIHDKIPPKVIIFDDSFSALDRSTEKTLRANLRQYLPETAFIIITERIISVEDAEQILLLEDGKTIGIGSHDNLLVSNPYYRIIYESQSV
jgi:ATP-binding cassette subfamily B protein